MCVCVSANGSLKQLHAMMLVQTTYQTFDVVHIMISHSSTR